MRWLFFALCSLLFGIIESKADVLGDVDCQMLSRGDYRDPIGGYLVFKRGEIVGGVSSVRVDLNSNNEAYCIHGGGCYPREDGFKLLNCRRASSAPIYEGMPTDHVYFDLTPINKE